MPITNIVLFFLACFTASCEIADGCEVIKGHSGFNYKDVKGNWYLGSGPRLLLQAFKSIVITAVPGEDTVTLIGTATQLKNLGLQNFGIPISLEVHWKFTKKNFSSLEATANSPFSIFNGNYDIVSFDPECHIVIQGCILFSLDPIIFILYRDREPKQNCIEETKAAFENAGFDYNAVVPDPAFPFKWW